MINLGPHLINLRGAKSTERVIWLRQDPSAACAAREVSDMAVGPGKIHRSIQKYTKTHRDTQKQAEIHRKTCPIVSNKMQVELVRLEKHLTHKNTEKYMPSVG